MKTIDLTNRKVNVRKSGKSLLTLMREDRNPECGDTLMTKAGAFTIVRIGEPFLTDGVRVIGAQLKHR